MTDTVKAWMQAHIFNHFPYQGWMTEILIVLLITAVIFYLQKFIYYRLKPRLEATRVEWDHIIINALHKPLGYFIWLHGLCIAAQLSSREFGQRDITLLIDPARILGSILIILWFLLRLIKKLEISWASKSSAQSALDPTTIHAIGKVLRLVVILTAGLVTLQTFGIGVSGIVAFGGISGAAVAFAAKDLLANFFGGFILYFDRPFKIGDWIRSPDRQIEGTVEHIGWRVCRIRTFDKRPLYVPNSMFTTIIIENPSRMLNRRIKTTIGVRYDDALVLDVLLKDIETMLREHPEIDVTQTLMVNLIEFGPSSLNFFIYTFTKTTNWVKFQAIQQDVFLKIINIIDSHGAQCAFPTTTVHVPNGVKLEALPEVDEQTIEAKR